jgi:flagellar hook-associated protein 3 FlgL
MRISLNTQMSTTLLNLDNQQEQIDQYTQQLSSGTTLSCASDDPYGWAQVMNVKQNVREYDSFVSNVKFATNWGQTTESCLNQLSDLLSQAKQLAISASSANMSSQSSTLATEANGILQDALNLANSQYGDQYIFAGTSTSTAPYSIDSSGNVTYSGDTNYIQVKTATGSATGSSTAVNLTGDDVFSFTSGGQTENVLHELWVLQNAISTGDTSTVSSSITTLTDAFTHVNDELTQTGSQLDNLTTLQSAISAVQTNSADTLSNIQDTDVAATTTKLDAVQTAYEAALKVTSSLTGLNLATILSSTG